MIFNRDNSGAEELRSLTGSYFANNDFAKVSGQIEQVSEEVRRMIGGETFSEIEKRYVNAQADDIITLLQRPIAIMATLRMYQRNDVSHEDSGRKVKIDSQNEKIPWEWQLKQDDLMQMEDYYRTMDVLMCALENSADTVLSAAWKNSHACKDADKLLIRSGEQMRTFTDIEQPYYSFYFLLPYLKQVQKDTVERHFGTGFADLLSISKRLQKNQDDEESSAHWYACMALVNLTLSRAALNTFVRPLPYGIIRGLLKNGANMKDKASVEELKLMVHTLRDDGMRFIDRMKYYRDSSVMDIPLVHENDSNNKFMIL